jgi:hypothetical protein
MLACSFAAAGTLLITMKRHLYSQNMGFEEVELISGVSVIDFPHHPEFTFDGGSSRSVRLWLGLNFIDSLVTCYGKLTCGCSLNDFS